jgi:hypothetical protein
MLDHGEGGDAEVFFGRLFMTVGVGIGGFCVFFLRKPDCPDRPDRSLRARGGN